MPMSSEGKTREWLKVSQKENVPNCNAIAGPETTTKS